MSFSEYLQLVEATADIMPPSGKPLSPQASALAQQPGQPAQPNQAIKPIQGQVPRMSGAQTVKPNLSYAKGVPPQQGMTVGLQGQGGVPVQGQITKIDQANRSAMVMNPTTNKEEQVGYDNLQPFMAGSSQQAPQMEDDKGLARMRQLAGIGEDASGGASCAGAIASAPTSNGMLARRNPVESAPKKEYVPKRAAQTVIGDTKPGQAMGELSANLAASDRKTASRSNNGFKR